MTNEQKAKEIANQNGREYIYDTWYSNEECEKSALEMAEWKDWQFKECLIELHRKMADEQSLSMPQEDFKKWSKYIHLIQSKIEEL